MIEITTIIPTIIPTINSIELADDEVLLIPFEFDIPEAEVGKKVEDPNEAEVGKKVVEEVGEDIGEGVGKGVGIVLIDGVPIFEEINYKNKNQVSSSFLTKQGDKR